MELLQGTSGGVKTLGDMEVLLAASVKICG